MRINEGNPLSRLYDILNDESYVFAIISASDKITLEMRNKPSEYKEQLENDKINNHMLRKLARSHHFGYRKLLGHYIMNDKQHTKCVDDSTLIIAKADDQIDAKLLLPFCKVLAKKFNQEAFFFKDTDNKLKLYYSNGKIENFGNFHPNLFSEYMSEFVSTKNKYRTDTFVFDFISESSATKGWAANMAADAHLRHFEKTGKIVED